MPVMLRHRAMPAALAFGIFSAVATGCVSAASAQTATSGQQTQSSDSPAAALPEVQVLQSKAVPQAKAKKKSKSVAKTKGKPLAVPPPANEPTAGTETAQIAATPSGIAAQRAGSLAASDTREAIIAAVNHGGDSDSTGAITGNIVGALRGTTSLPREWTDQVELGDVIHTLAEDLTTVLEGSVDPDELWDRYPGW